MFKLKLKCRLDILNLEWPHSERDLSITLPVLLYLNKNYRLRFEVRNIFYGLFFLLFYRPKVLLMSNATGSYINVLTAHFAKNIGVKVVSLISEGNFIASSLDEFLWGHNRNKIWNLDLLLVWNEFSRKLIVNKYPDLASHVFTVGNIGVDKHLISKVITKNDFLIRFNKVNKFDKIVCISGWCFDFFHLKNLRSEFTTQDERELHHIQIQLDSLKPLQEIYSKMVKDFSNILFVFKYHPGTLSKFYHEFHSLNPEDKNMIIIDVNDSSFSLTDLISISDLWIAYDSTTTIEAWTLSKPTLLINPITDQFIRHDLYLGSLMCKNYEQLIDYFKLLLSESLMSQFDKDELVKMREAIIKNTFYSLDGKNHIRAAEVIIENLKIQNNSFIQVGFSDLRIAFYNSFKTFILGSRIVKKLFPKYNYISKDHTDKKLRIIFNQIRHNF